MAAAAALAAVQQPLTWIAFNIQAHQDSICNEAGFASLKDGRLHWIDQERYF